MDKARLSLCVVPSCVELTNIVDYMPEHYGKIFSTLNEIKVNKTSTGYGIIYHSNDINNMDMDILGNNIIKILMQNLPNTSIELRLIYTIKVKDEYDDVDDVIDISVVNSLLELESKFAKFNQNDNIPFTYIRSDNMEYIITNVIKNYQDIDEEDEEDDDLPDYFEKFGINPIDDEDDEDDEDDDSFSLLDHYVKNGNYSNNTTTKRKRNKKYQQSRVLYDAKNPKRSYSRHGVICTDKESKKRDEKILKEFLKEFFPGNAEWKKEFRHEVLKRWMKMYCVTKKDLKELERTHRKARNAKRNNVKTEKTLEFTRRLFNVPIDRWNDPNR